VIITTLKIILAIKLKNNPKNAPTPEFIALSISFFSKIISKSIYG